MVRHGSASFVPVATFLLAVGLAWGAGARPSHSLRTAQQQTDCKHVFVESRPEPRCLDSEENGVAGADCLKDAPDTGYLWYREIEASGPWPLSARSHGGTRNGGMLRGPVPPTNLRIIKRVTGEKDCIPCHGTTYSASGMVSTVVRLGIPVLPFDNAFGSAASSLTLRHLSDCSPNRQVDGMVRQTVSFTRLFGRLVLTGICVKYVSNANPPLQIEPSKPVTPPINVFVCNKPVFLPSESGRVMRTCLVDWAGSSFIIRLRAPRGDDGNLNVTDGDALARFSDSSLIDHVEPVGE